MKGSLLLLSLIGSLFHFQWLHAQDTTAEKHQILIVAHRGAAKFAPENTIAAFLKAAEMGADYAEMDVRQTKDGVLILMHDRTVRRTTDGKGAVADLTLDELKKLDAGRWFSKEYKGEPVPTLREVLRAIKGKILPDIDFKEGDPEKLVALLKEEGYLEAGNVTFHGSWKDCERIKELTDKIMIRPGARGGAQALDALIEALDPPIVNVGKSSFTEYYINLIHYKGKLAFVNALRRADKKRFMERAIEAGADFLQADNLDVLIPLVETYNNR